MLLSPQEPVTITCVEAAGLGSWCRAVASVWACSVSYVSDDLLCGCTVLCWLAGVQLELYFVCLVMLTITKVTLVECKAVRASLVDGR